MAMCACCRLRCLGPAVTGLMLRSAGFHWPRVARLMGVVQRWLEDACVRHAQNLPRRWMWRCFEYRKLEESHGNGREYMWHMWHMWQNHDHMWHKHLCSTACPKAKLKLSLQVHLGCISDVWTVRRTRDCSDCEIECPTGVRSKVLWRYAMSYEFPTCFLRTRCIQHFPLSPGKKWWDYHVTQAAGRVAQYHPGAVSKD